VLGLRLRTCRPSRTSWLRRRRGQAMVETALAAPFVLLLLAGGAQIASISYGQVTIDTAAREGARVATEHPVTALTNSSTGVSFFSSSGSTSYTCNGVGDPNIVCQAVYDSPGLLQSMFDKSKFTVVITANVPQARAPQPAFDGVPDDVEQIGCQGGVQVGGTVSGVSGNVKYDVSASGTGQTLTTQTNPQGSYSLCIAVTSAQTETITASYGTLSCGLPAYQGSAQVSVAPSGGPYSADIKVSAQTCPTPNPTSNSTPTPNATPFPSPTPLPSTHYGFVCNGAAASIDGTYITVKVSYPMPIFVPFVDRLLNSGNGTHTTTATVTMRVEPCGITQGT
jgi:Flp pilus assembly protein TadG